MRAIIFAFAANFLLPNWFFGIQIKTFTELYTPDLQTLTPKTVDTKKG